MDIRVDLYIVKGHVMNIMREHGIKCKAMASVPLGDCWWLWDAIIPDGTILPDGFKVADIARDTPYYKDGYFVNGMSGIESPMPLHLFWQ